MLRVRDFLLQVHLWTGLLAGLLFIALGLSGSALVYPGLLTAFDTAPPKVSSQGAALPLEQIIDAARRAAPDGARAAANLTLARPGTADADRVQFGRGGSAQLFVDPITAQVLAIRPAGRATLIGLIHQLHEAFLLPGGFGRGAVGWIGVAMLFLGLSGLVLWWPRHRRWRQAFVIRRDARGAALYRDIHAAFGIWFWAIFVFVSVTGLLLSFPSLAGWLGGEPARGPGGPGGFAAPPRISVPADTERLPLASLIAAVERKVGGKVTGISVPAQPEQAVRISLSREGRPSVLFVDPYRGTLIGQPPQDRSGWNRSAIEHLHGGSRFGEVGKFLVFVVGFLPLLFATTGLLLWSSRRRRAALPSAIVR